MNTQSQNCRRWQRLARDARDEFESTVQATYPHKIPTRLSRQENQDRTICACDSARMNKRKLQAREGFDFGGELDPLEYPLRPTFRIRPINFAAVTLGSEAEEKMRKCGCGLRATESHARRTQSPTKISLSAFLCALLGRESRCSLSAILRRVRSVADFTALPLLDRYQFNIDSYTVLSLTTESDISYARPGSKAGVEEYQRVPQKTLR